MDILYFHEALVDLLSCENFWLAVISHLNFPTATLRRTVQPVFRNSGCLNQEAVVESPLSQPKGCQFPEKNQVCLEIMKNAHQRRARPATGAGLIVRANLGSAQIGRLGISGQKRQHLIQRQTGGSGITQTAH